jgi:hypothetical protein
MKRPSVIGFWSLFFFCIASSLLGIVWAVLISKHPEDGGRGGAVAVAAALFSLFMSKSYGIGVFEARTKVIPELIEAFERLGNIPSTPRTADENSEAIRSGLVDLLKSEAAAQKRQNLFLAAATAVGTIIWGFGDLVAKFVMQILHISK